MICVSNAHVVVPSVMVGVLDTGKSVSVDMSGLKSLRDLFFLCCARCSNLIHFGGVVFLKSNDRSHYFIFGIVH